MYGDGEPKTTARQIIDDFTAGLLAPDTPTLTPIVTTASYNYVPARVALGVVLLWLLWPNMRKH